VAYSRNWAGSRQSRTCLHGEASGKEHWIGTMVGGWMQNLMHGSMGLNQLMAVNWTGEGKKAAEHTYVSLVMSDHR
jgi:hypothetical protein